MRSPCLFAVAIVVCLTSSLVSIASDIKSISGTLVEIDKEKRSIVVRDASAKLSQLTSPEGLIDFDQIAVGAKVSVFFDADSLTLTKFRLVSDPGPNKDDDIKQVAEPLDRALRSASALENLAQRCPSARDALLLYRAFIDHPKVDPSEKAKAAASLPDWESAAQDNLHRVGKEWMPEPDAATRREQANELMKQSFELLRSKNLKEAMDRLVEATKEDPDNIEPACWLGIVSASLAFDYKTAHSQFMACAKLTPGDAGPLNNLAICAIHQRKFEQATSYLQAALKADSGFAPALHNLSVIALLANSKDNAAPFRDMKAAVNNKLQKLAETYNIRAPSEIRSLIYAIPASFHLKQDGKGVAEEQSSIVGYGSGFVVAPGIVMTNKHVVQRGSTFAIVDPSDPKRKLMARVVSRSNRFDLALLECRDLESNSLPIGGPVSRGREICVFGYPDPTQLGDQLKLTDGRVISLPDPKIQGMFLHNAIANPGNSGGPICDRTGKVVGVLTAGFFQLDNPVCAGIPAVDILSYLKEQMIEPEPPKKSVEFTPEQLDKLVSPSVVQIQALGAQTSRLGGDMQVLFVDRGCLYCDERGESLCSEPNCKNGRVPTRDRIIFEIDPKTNQPTIRQPKGGKDICRVCDGDGKITCPHCQGRKK